MKGGFRKQILHETPDVIGVARRDTPRRVAGCLLMVAVLATGGAFVPAIQLLAIYAGFEVLALFAFASYMRRIEEAPSLGAWGIWTLSVISLATIAAPSLILANMQSVPLMIAGLIWLFGVIVHVTNTYAALPIYKWSMLVLPITAASLATVAGSVRSYEEAPEYHLFLALGLLLVYCANAYDTLRKQNDTFAELDAARQDASTRLTQLEHLNQHDALTGLKNRSAFDDEVDRRQRDSDTNTVPLTVYLLDLDGFKPINDSYTHAAGDAILRETGSRLLSFFDGDDIVARLGGDEFAIATFKPITQDAAIKLAQAMIARISDPVDFGQRQLSVGCSIGLTRSVHPSQTAALLLNQADQAMYRAKDDAASPVKVFDQATYPQRATLDDRVVLIEAMESGEILPFYQPKIDLRSGTMLGMEALARWEHPAEGMIMPGKFLPLITELSLQGHFLDHSLKRTLADIEDMLKAGLNPGQVSVNLPEVPLATISGRDSLKTLLSHHPGALPFLTFEVTEDIFIARSNSIIQDSIMQFRRMGVRISLDDFGTGFASFQHLRELEFDELKLDTGFVRGLGEETEAEVLVRAFLNIGHGLDVDVIAEGVETDVQRKMLSDMGCISAQGFLFSKAIPFDQIKARLKREQFTDIPGITAA